MQIRFRWIKDGNKTVAARSRKNLDGLALLPSAKAQETKQKLTDTLKRKRAVKYFGQYDKTEFSIINFCTYKNLTNCTSNQYLFL